MASSDVDPERTPSPTGGDTSGSRSEGVAGRVRHSASEAYEAARQRTNAIYGSARERATNAYSSTREGASRVKRRTVEEIDANPVAAVAGGFALGALIGAILPSSRREAEMFGAIGARINQAALEAAQAARDAGQEQLDELGLNRDGARQKLNELATTATDAVRSSAAAAAERIRKPH